MNVLIRKNLVETSAKGTTYENLILPLAIRINSIGAYHLSNLVTAFEYFDGVIVDTPIFDESVRANIQDVPIIVQRLNRAKLFLTYLDQIWEEFFDKKENVYLDWGAISSQLKREFAIIDNKITF
jgi:hypothetical protein